MSDEKRDEDVPSPLADYDEAAWGLIANAWDYVEKAADETKSEPNHAKMWVDAAKRWRDAHRDRAREAVTSKDFQVEDVPRPEPQTGAELCQ